MASDRVGQAVITHLGAPFAGTQNRGSFSSKGRITRTGIAALDEVRRFPVRLGQLVEIVGGSGSGKTQLLHLIAAHSLSDPNSKSSTKVCWFDLNGGLDPVRLAQLMQVAGRPHQQPPEESVADLPGLQVYQPESTPALCAALRKLPEFLKSSDGAAVDAIIIDSLGSFHYLDKQQVDWAKDSPGKGYSPLSNELILTRILSDILRDSRIVVYVSKCALFGQEKLSVPWPFPEAGIPSIPTDFMPSMWRSIVSHVLLIYQVQQHNEGDKSSSRRGVVSLGQKQGSSSQELAVYAAGTVVISKDGLTASSDLHVV